MSFWDSLAQYRTILATETDADSPGSEELASQIREQLEVLIMLLAGLHESGTVTTITETVLTASGEAWDDDDYNGQTLIMTSGTANGNTYTIDDSATAGPTVTCTGDTLVSDGVAINDTFVIVGDIKTPTTGHDHDGVNSKGFTLVAGSVSASNMISNDVVDSQHYAADSIDAEHYASGSVDQTAIGAGAVHQGELGTTTPSKASGDLALLTNVDIDMHDFCFFPHIYSENQAIGFMGNSDDTDNTQGMFCLRNYDASNARLYEVSWRYVSASDMPFVYFIRDSVSGEISHIWMGADSPQRYWGKGHKERPVDFIPPLRVGDASGGNLLDDTSLEDVVVFEYGGGDKDTGREAISEITAKAGGDKKRLFQSLNDDFDYDADSKLFVRKNLSMI